MERGICKWFNGSKGWGFITRPNGADLFVHFTEISMDGYKTLNEGQAVEYDVAKNAKGFQAVNVSPAYEVGDIRNTNAA